MNRQILTTCLLLLNFLALIANTKVIIDPWPDKKKPNIVIIFADDLGHADVGFTEGNHQTPTPNIDKLAWEGIILNRHYSLPTCGPSRAALMTAKYPFQTGMFTPIAEGEPWGLPLKYKIMPQYFQELGYQTVALGKWHLGQYKKAFLPTHRGFDYWLGYGSGNINLFNYSAAWWDPVKVSGRDFYENDKFVPWNVLNNHYLPDLLVEKAEQMIYNADPDKPLFLYFATPLPRCSQDGPLGNETQFTMPQYLQRPPIKTVNKNFPERRKQLAAIQALDEHVKRIVDALRNKGILDNTIIVFMSDNGAADVSHSQITPAWQRGVNHGSNWPMRHSKSHFFEGGVWTPAFIWSPLIKRSGRIYNDLFHLIDWLPTLYEAAGETWPAPSVNKEMADLFNTRSQWKALSRGIPQGQVAPRNHMIVEIAPPIFGQAQGREAAIFNILDKQGNVKQMWKMVSGPTLNTKFTGWTRTEGTSPGNEMRTPTAASANCLKYPPGTEVGEKCLPLKAPCLFELISDPCEANNLFRVRPDVLKGLQGMLNETKKSMVPSERKLFDPAAHPDHWNNMWVPWKDADMPEGAVKLVEYSPFNPPDSF